MFESATVGFINVHNSLGLTMNPHPKKMIVKFVIGLLVIPMCLISLASPAHSKKEFVPWEDAVFAEVGRKHGDAAARRDLLLVEQSPGDEAALDGRALAPAQGQPLVPAGDTATGVLDDIQEQLLLFCRELFVFVRGRNRRRRRVFGLKRLVRVGIGGITAHQLPNGLIGHGALA